MSGQGRITVTQPPRCGSLGFTHSSQTKTMVANASSCHLGLRDGEQTIEENSPAHARTPVCTCTRHWRQSGATVSPNVDGRVYDPGPGDTLLAAMGGRTLPPVDISARAKMSPEDGVHAGHYTKPAGSTTPSPAQGRAVGVEGRVTSRKSTIAESLSQRTQTVVGASFGE